MSVVIAERELTVDRDGCEEPGWVRIYAPEKVRDDEWRCSYEIVWPGFERRHRATGGDSYQALLLALSVVPFSIEMTADFKADRLKWLGESLSDPQRPRSGLREAFGLTPIGGKEG